MISHAESSSTGLVLEAGSSVRACKRGHAMTDGNVYFDKRGVAICRQCIRLSRAAFIARQPADYGRKRYLDKMAKDRSGVLARALVNHRKRKFGLTPEAFTAMVDEQNGVCAICLKPSLDRALAVDHCHTSGKIRGLLCKRCNMALGLFGDSPLVLRRATNYIVEAQH